MSVTPPDMSWNRSNRSRPLDNHFGVNGLATAGLKTFSFDLI